MAVESVRSWALNCRATEIEFPVAVILNSTEAVTVLHSSFGGTNEGHSDSIILSMAVGNFTAIILVNFR